MAFFSRTSLTNGSLDLTFMKGMMVQSSGPLCPFSWKFNPTGFLVYGSPMELLCSLHLSLTCLFVCPTYWPLYPFWSLFFPFPLALMDAHASQVQMYRHLLLLQVRWSLMGMIWPLCLISNCVMSLLLFAPLLVKGHIPQVLSEQLLKHGLGSLVVRCSFLQTAVLYCRAAPSSCVV